jgi:hypothetical protein
MLAIAGVVTWLGYGVFVYGFSQVRGQNYSIGDLLIPGKFVAGVPADSSSGSTTGTTGTGGAGLNLTEGNCKRGIDYNLKTKKCCTAATPTYDPISGKCVVGAQTQPHF